MKSHWCEEEFPYTGEQLKSLFGYLKFGIAGDSIVGWTGPCDIPFEHMADGEDLRQKAVIRGARMVHFIVEKFGVSLYGAVALQRLLASLALDVLTELSPRKEVTSLLRRDGDDLYVGERKLSISIAAPSMTSCLIHFAVNQTNDGTPVPTISLNEFGLQPVPFANRLMERFVAEETAIVFATQKVKGLSYYN